MWSSLLDYSCTEEMAGLKETIPCCVWWNNPERTGYERKFAVLGLLFLLLSIIFIIWSSVTHHQLTSVNKICHTKECIHSASQMLSNIDSNVDPCKDFYEFSCGNYQKKKVVQDDEYAASTMGDMQNDIYIELKKLLEEPVSSSDSKVIVKTKNLYASCINSSVEDGSMDEILNLLERVGRWPIIDSKWSERDDPDTERRLAILFVHGIFPFIDPNVFGDSENITDYIFSMGSGSLILPYEFYLNSSNTEFEKYINSYKKMIIETTRILGADESTIQKDLEDMLEFERKYAEISRDALKEWYEMMEKLISSETEEEEEAKRYNVYKLRELIPEIEWKDFFDYIFNYFNLPVKTEFMSIVVKSEEYLRHLTVLLKKTSRRTVANYLTWRFVYKLMPYLDEHFSRLFYDFMKEVPAAFEKSASSSRWKDCISILENQFSMPLTALYVRDNFDASQREGILRLISAIKQEYNSAIQQKDWMDNTAKTLSQKKLQKMKVKMGFPRYALDEKELAKDYSGLEISADGFLQNMLRVKRLKTEKSLSLLTGKTTRDDDWLDEPLTVNAYYIPFQNKMVFPLATLRFPFFVTGRPNYLNYAGLGETISHEITHGFDTGGIDYVLGFKKWNPKTQEKYRELANCFVEQYSQLPLGIPGKRVNGKETINDNLCDNASLKTSYKAYQTYVSQHGEEPALPGVPYNNDQVFFIKYAQGWCELPSDRMIERYQYDEHSPPKHRANIPMSNSEEFSEAFNCPKGSPMNPKKKCYLWG